MSKAPTHTRQVAAPQDLADDQARAKFLDLVTPVLESLAARLDASELNKALATRHKATALLTALSQPGAIGMFEKDALRPARLRGLQARDDLLAADGGTVAADQVGKRLGISVQAVEKRRAAGKLIALEVPRRGHRFPAWQFEGGGLLPGMEEILKLLADHPPLAQMRFFLSGSRRLSGERPLDVLRRGELEPVRRAARTFGEHGAA